MAHGGVNNGGTKTPRSRGAYGSTRGKERQRRKADAREQNPRYTSAMEDAREKTRALDELIEKQKLEPAEGPVAGAMYAAQRKAAEDAAAVATAEVTKIEVAEELDNIEPEKPKKEPVVKAPKAFVARPYAWRKKIPEFGDESKQQPFCMVTARIMAKTGYNIQHIFNTTAVGWGDLEDLGEWDEDGYLIFDLGEDDAE